MRTGKMMAMLGGALLAASAVAAPSVEITAVQQQYPWTNTVDITYVVQGVTNMEYFVRFTPTTSDDDPILNTEGEPSIQVALESNGVFTAQWYPQTNLQYTACKMTPAIFRGGSGGGRDYMIVDLATGAVTYEPMATQEASNERYNTVEYKTKKMVFRKVEAGDYPIRGGNVTAKMAKPYYIAIFQMTQAQYGTLVGNSAYTSLKPVGLSYNVIRGNALATANVSSAGNGPIARINAKTGLYFDLPNEAMWEVAVRALTNPSWNWFFGATDSALGNYAIISSNSGGVLNEVGRKAPNPWGLYDVYGNAYDIVRDTAASSAGPGSDATDTTKWPISNTQTPLHKGTYTILRGASYNNNSYWANSICRHIYWSVSYAHDRLGFRLAMIVE